MITNFIIHDKPRHTGESPAFTSVSDGDCGDLGVQQTFFNHADKGKTISPRQVQVLQPNKTCKCGACVPPKPKLPEGTRRLKVYSKWKANGYEQDPVIMLQGEWLRNNGFNIGDEILVTVNQK